MKKQKIAVVLLLVVSMIFISISQGTLMTVRAATQATYYVDPVNGNDNNNGTSINTPWLTITKAQTYIRATKGNMTGDIYVYLRGGTYTLSSTINFTDLDSGTNGYYVRYVAYGSEKPVLSGGQQITGWTQVAGKNFYQANCNINTLAQLYVNGNRAQIAHSEVSYSGLSWYDNTSDPNSTTDGIVVDPSVIGTNWRNKSDIQLVLDPKYQDWHEPHELVSDVITSGANNVIVMKQPYFNWATTQLYGYNWNATDSFKIQNAYELLDQPGEWYLDRTAHILYYYPKAGENINTAVVIAPTLEKLINIKGTSLTSLATDISFQNITMMYGTWLDPTTNGFCGPQEDIYYSGTSYTSPSWNEPLGNITVEDANYVDFIGCDIEHMGGTGILLLNADDNCQILGCKIEDISASGIQVGKENNNTNFGVGDRQCRYCLVKDNYVRFAPIEYNQCVSIYSPCAESLEVSHNEVYDSPYTAINVGLYLSDNIDTTCLNNKVDYNRVVRAMTTLNDGGAIYMHGYQGGTNEIKYNYIQEFAPKSGWGSAIYHDNASANYTTSNNVVENINGSDWISAQNTPLSNITITNNYVTSDIKGVDTTQPNVTVSNTTVENAPPAAWDSAAQAIINGSGLESAYQYIRATDTYVLKNALNQTEAENYDAQSGTIVQSSSDGGQEVSGIDNGDWLEYNSIDFGSVKTCGFQARVSGVNSGGSIEIREDTSNGPVLGTLNITPTGSLTTYNTQTCSITPTVGVHAIFLMFKGSSSGLFNLNWFKFVPTATKSAFSQIEAENYDTQSGTIVSMSTGAPENGTELGSINNGNWVLYNNLDFGSVGVSSFDARLSAVNGGGSIQVRDGSSTGTLLGTLAIQYNANWSIFTTQVCAITPITGIHNICLVFTGASGICGLNWLTFIAPVVKSALSQIEAENFDTQSGTIQVLGTGAPENGTELGGINNKNWVLYNNLDFGSFGANGFDARLSAVNGGGSIQVRDGSSTGTLLGTLTIQYNANWSIFTTQVCTFAPITGVHNICLLFKGSSNGICGLNWFKFTVPAFPITFDAYNVSASNIITNVQPGTTGSQLLANNKVTIATGTTYVINNPSGSHDVGSVVGTGTTIVVSYNGTIYNTYTILVYGDLNGDGVVDLKDLVSIRADLLGTEIFTGVFYSAGDLYREGNITLNDLVGMMSYISQNGTISQNLSK